MTERGLRGEVRARRLPPLLPHPAAGRDRSRVEGGREGRRERLGRLLCPLPAPAGTLSGRSISRSLPCRTGAGGPASARPPGPDLPSGRRDPARCQPRPGCPERRWLERRKGNESVSVVVVSMTRTSALVSGTWCSMEAR